MCVHMQHVDYTVSVSAGGERELLSVVGGCCHIFLGLSGLGLELINELIERQVKVSTMKLMEPCTLGGGDLLLLALVWSSHVSMT